MTESLSPDGYGYISENLKRIRENISEAALRSGRRPEEVTLMAVTKTVEPPPIKYAIANCGINLIGENKVQELLGKLPFIDSAGVNAHIIGHLQSNKVKKIVGIVSMVQSVDSIHIAEEISKASLSFGCVTDILCEVNIGGEENKTGFSPDELKEALWQIGDLGGVRVRGLMTVPPVCDNEAEVCKFFQNMYRIFVDNRIEKRDNVLMDYLSMGMTGDYVPAIEQGSNMVRIGSGIFGARKY